MTGARARRREPTVERAVLGRPIRPPRERRRHLAVRAAPGSGAHRGRALFPSATGLLPGADPRRHFLVAVATLLLVFLLEHNEDRDKTALHIKLDEILTALRDADRGKVGVEDLPAERLREIRDAERETVRSGRR